MAPDSKDQEWYSIAEQASTEVNSEKLALLVSQLCAALDKRIRPQASEVHTEDKASWFFSRDPALRNR
jgi:hypothetical protein